ncbi:anti-sigma factor [Undibacterium sp. 5I1]|uniref:anti-sigma factor n=1 Tax=unclassified Undibacterium TaxID=2630295 RepID=UPI002AB59BC5|nr:MULTISPECIES: anti-sigma factor [unclassified Undibacterium]MDY7539586.1 anti-sigma factor [Undibacterium sp. 5I1]MEB0230464.1 anti-sigma factor [Undibacterium sp. 10I3]MEB0258474.1 anti-sigma factor [Undibacterium sp. 5I1]
MNIQNKPNLQQKLAAEYVLGTLRGGARRRFEGWLNRDAQLQQVVRQWEGNLLPMAEFAKTAQPANSVWQSLEKRLGLNQSADRWAFWRNLREDLAFWRGLGMFSTAMALVMVSVLLSKQVDQTLPPTNSYVATLSNDKSEPIAVITGDIKHKQLIVHIVKAQNIAADKSLELWAVSKAGTVKSLGLVADNGNITLPMPDNMNSDNVPLLAVTLEPKGGSGNPEKPTGPIVFKGNWLLI